MTFTLFLILAFATYRLARAVALDDITEGGRQWMYRKSTFGYRLISCPQCVGWWLAFVVTGVWFWATTWPGTVEWLIYAVATAGFQSAMATLSHRLDTIDS